MASKNLNMLLNPLNLQNPITVQILGVCSALAITIKLKPALVMGLSVVVVTAFSNLLISLLRNYIPPRIRIIAQLIVVAAMVILIDQVLKAFVYDVSKQLSVYVGLIITNCIILGRLEAFAMGNKPWPSFIDGLGNGAGYAAILIVVAVFRELFGSCSLLGYKIIPDRFYEAGFVDNGMMNMPTMALILVGIIVWIQRSRFRQLNEKE